MLTRLGDIDLLMSRFWRMASEFWGMSRLEINLRWQDTCGNNPFFADVVKKHYLEALARPATRLFVPRMVYGVAVCRLPPRFEDYYMAIESSARRNHKKAVREGCHFCPLVFNDHLEEIAEIRASATHRQGREMPVAYLAREITPINDPPSNNSLHGYPYFGVSLNGRLIGYVSCLIAGEYAGIEHILGHADYLDYRVVPQLIIGISEHLYTAHPSVKYYCYGTYFGATETMRRFKRKFGFLPHRVRWVLGDVPQDHVTESVQRNELNKSEPMFS